MDIRAAELTADHLGRIVKINPGDPTVIVGRLISVRHKVRKAAPSETETQLEIEVKETNGSRRGLTPSASSSLPKRPQQQHAEGCDVFDPLSAR
jgi:hypothetical protein